MYLCSIHALCCLSLSYVLFVALFTECLALMKSIFALSVLVISSFLLMSYISLCDVILPIHSVSLTNNSWDIFATSPLIYIFIPICLDVNASSSYSAFPVVPSNFTYTQEWKLTLSILCNTDHVNCRDVCGVFPRPEAACSSVLFLWLADTWPWISFLLQLIMRNQH